MITPAVLSHLNQKDYTWYIREYKPDYIVNEYPEVQIYVGGKAKLFIDNYELVKIFESKKAQIAIYKKSKYL